MIITFHGAAGTVTGSCTELFNPETGDRTLVDCGILQGESDADSWNEGQLPFDPSDIDRVFVTHAHMDHIGLLPVLVRHGFHGRVYATRPTIDVAKNSLRDACRRACFSHRDIKRIEWRELRVPSRPQDVGPFRVSLYRSAHALGAVSIRLTWDGPEGRNTVLFSGDLGCNETARTAWQPILHHRDAPEPVAGGYVVMESTYGGAARDPEEEQIPHRLQTLRSHMWAVVEANGRLLIPAFAFGRTHDILTDIHVVLARDPELADALGGLYVASGLALKHARVYAAVLEQEASRKRPAWLSPRFADYLQLDSADPHRHGDAATLLRAMLRREPVAQEPSWGAVAQRFVPRWKELDGEKIVPPRSVVIGGSGTGDFGAMKDLLYWHLESSNTHVLLSGYAPPSSAVGTLRRIQHARLAGQRLRHLKVRWDDGTCVKASRVQAVIGELRGYSGHADRKSLTRWAIPGGGQSVGDCFFLNHGTDESRVQLEDALIDRAFATEQDEPWVEIPEAGASFDLHRREWISKEERARLLERWRLVIR